MSWSTSNRASRLPKNWHRVRAFVLERDRRTCQIRSDRCTLIANQVDHVIAGDNHDPSNLRAVCSACHATKSSREGSTAATERRKLRYRPIAKHPGRIE